MAYIQSKAEASAPGSMILMGEYAVLEGARAVLMTLRHRLRVTLTQSGCFEVLSDKFPPYRAAPTKGGKPAHVLLCENVLGGLPPLRVEVSSDIPPTYGFASSAAFVAALLKALFRLQGREES